MTDELNIGQKIVHPRYGAGTVLRVRKGRKHESHDRYYVIDIPSADLKVHLPVENLDGVAVRNLASMTRINRALSVLRTEPAELPKDSRERCNGVAEVMADGKVMSLAQVLRDLHGLQRTKPLSMRETNLYTKAKRQLAGELALAASIPLDKAVQRIEGALRQSPSPEA